MNVAFKKILTDSWKTTAYMIQLSVCQANLGGAVCDPGPHNQSYGLGVDRLSAPILSILPIIDIGHFKNRFADNYYYYFFLCKQTYYLQVTLFIGE